jgi:hypothetical protein
MANVKCLNCGTEIPNFLAKRTNGICGDCGGKVKYSQRTMAIVKGSLLSFFIVVAIVMTTVGIFAERRTNQIKEHWTITSAKVTDFREVYLRDGGVTDSEADDRKYCVEYAYTVDGVKYASEYSRRISSGTRSKASREEHTTFYHNHQPGKPVQIYYSPENPEECYLAREVDLGQVL